MGCSVSRTHKLCSDCTREIRASGVNSSAARRALSQIAGEAKKRRLSVHISPPGVLGLILSGSALIADHDWFAMYWPLTIAVLSLVLW